MFAAVMTRASMSDGKYEFIHSISAHRSTVVEAQADGFSLADGTDDFLIAVIESDQPVDLRELVDLKSSDMSELDWPEVDYTTLARHVGLRWNTDASHKTG